MGKVSVTAKIESLADLYLADRGELEPDGVRAVDVQQALVDTGATSLSMPLSLINRLGLKPIRRRNARTSAGVVTVRIFQTVRLTIQGRDCNVDVTELPEECPILIGQVPLELLDFVVDPIAHRLIGNPEHGGEHIIELY